MARTLKKTATKASAKKSAAPRKRAPAAKAEAPAPAETKPKRAAPRAKTNPSAKTKAAPRRSAAPRSTVEKATAAAASAASSARATASKAASRAKDAVAAIPVPEVTARQAAIGAAATGGVLAAVGAAFFLWRASQADQPEYKLVEQDGDFEVREYPALVTAATETRGPRQASLERGFRTLADYIFAKSRSGEKLAMTAPVLHDGSATGGWRTRFLMPFGKARGDLPTPPAGVTLDSEPPRRIGAVRFSGRADDALLAAKEGALRSWLQLRSLPSEAKAVHAFYNSPMMPGPFRRNEVLVTLSEG